MSGLTPAVEKAIGEIRSSFSDCEVAIDEDGSGGVYVKVEPIPLGRPYAQDTIWIAFQITYQYPYADVYPHFTCSDLRRADGRSLGEGLGQATYRGTPAIQISRRSNRLNPATDTAALKLLKVLQWLRNHP